jgi:hypothetical protein
MALLVLTQDIVTAANTGREMIDDVGSTTVAILALPCTSCSWCVVAGLGERWRGEAAADLRALGLDPPLGFDAGT